MTFPILGGNSAVSADAQANSLRFNDNDSAYLSRTISSGSDITKFTYSFWVKRSTLGSNRRIISNTTSSKQLYIRFTNSDTFEAFHTAGGTGSSSYVFYLQTTAKFRDVSAWYHILIKFDSTQSTEADRTKIYVNGNQITDLEDNTQPSQNEVAQFINTGQRQDIGTYNQSSEYFDGYLAEFHFLDSISLTPTDFGEFDSTSGIWKVKEYTGSYGTNGYKLNFSDSGSLGADSSGNGNDFTASNLASTDQMLDSPTNNFATINSINASSVITISEGNLRTTAVSAWYSALGTIYATSGKWYFESVLTVDNWVMVGVAPTSQDINLNPGGGAGTKSMALVFSTDSSRGDITYNNVNSAYTDGGHGINTGDIISVALDLDNNNVKFYKNNTQLYNLSNLLSDEPYTFGVSHYNGSALVSNFGQDGTFAGAKTAQGNSDGNGYGDFYYAPPSGYLALCTQNLATELSPTIDDGSDYFNTVLYTGNDSNGHGITGVGFQPDWTWIKARTDVRSHSLVDINRGAGKILSSHHTSAEYTDTTAFASFDSDGFTVGTDYAYINDNSHNYVAWNWLASNTTASNTDGSVTSTVSANTTAGFSIVTHTGTGSGSTTVGHGLGKVPAMIIVKDRGQARSWNVYHQSIGNNSGVNLNGTGAQSGADSGWWNNTTPTSSVFTLGTYANESSNYVSYCFAEIEGYSKFGSYTGNGSTDGTFVHTGFKPAFVLIKRTDGGDHWNIPVFTSDANGTVNTLSPNLSNAERTMEQNPAIDYYSNGFKIRTSDANYNGNGGTYLYMAFGHTFVDSNGNPNTAR